MLGKWRPANWAEGGRAVQGLKVAVFCLALAMMLGWTMAAWNCYRIVQLEGRMARVEEWTMIPKRPGKSIQHIAAEPDMEKREQRCSRCEVVLIAHISHDPFFGIWPVGKPVYRWEHGSGVRCETESYDVCARPRHR